MENVEFLKLRRELTHELHSRVSNPELFVVGSEQVLREDGTHDGHPMFLHFLRYLKELDPFVFCRELLSQYLDNFVRLFGFEKSQNGRSLHLKDSLPFRLLLPQNLALEVFKAVRVEDSVHEDVGQVAVLVDQFKLFDPRLTVDLSTVTTQPLHFLTVGELDAFAELTELEPILLSEFAYKVGCLTLQLECQS